MNNSQPLRGFRVPMTEGDVIIVNKWDWDVFAEVEEIDVVELSLPGIDEGRPITFIQPIRGSTKNLDKDLLFTGSIRTPIVRENIVGICCPQCWHAGEYRSAEDQTLLGLVVDDKMYRICERCGYHKKA